VDKFVDLIKRLGGLSNFLAWLADALLYASKTAEERGLGNKPIDITPDEKSQD